MTTRVRVRRLDTAPPSAEGPHHARNFQQRALHSVLDAHCTCAPCSNCSCSTPTATPLIRLGYYYNDFYSSCRNAYMTTDSGFVTTSPAPGPTMDPPQMNSLCPPCSVTTVLLFDRVPWTQSARCACERAVDDGPSLPDVVCQRAAMMVPVCPMWRVREPSLLLLCGEHTPPMWTLITPCGP